MKLEPKILVLKVYSRGDYTVFPLCTGFVVVDRNNGKRIVNCENVENAVALADELCMAAKVA